MDKVRCWLTDLILNTKNSINGFISINTNLQTDYQVHKQRFAATVKSYFHNFGIKA